ncbi:hypothetical protein [Streptomyces sp. NBC_00842]|uniref:hypothetical protein n=1 Tax=Streptomyces sp. NBC_00842 TaxID=2975848 RepID=UPI00386317EE|nr:hypothetical protein OH821_33030 [Streptomyces sp. NBC_00842]
MSAGHHRLTGPTALPTGRQVISVEHTDQRTVLFVRGSAPAHDAAWSISRHPLDDIVLAYMSTSSRSAAASRDLLPVTLETSW